ncbi:MAG: response regulator [Candidatus Kuenenia sp.]|nr:response regulator [Candidatus Kuenenia hertensis]
MIIEETKPKEELIILVAEDNEGHALLITKNLKRAGISNKFLHSKDGQEVLDFLFKKGKGPHREYGKSYLLLLDIRMPKVDGIEVLRQIKTDPELSKMPVIMVTTTDDPREVDNCHKLGCSTYITKPIHYEKFTDAIRKLGLFLTIVRLPVLNGVN